MMKKIVIIGAGGFAKKVVSLINDINEKEPGWELLGFIDDDINKKHAKINGIEVLGNLEDYIRMNDEIWCVIAIGNGTIREKIASKIKNKKFATLIHPNVIIDEYVNIGVGVIICCNNAVAVNTNIADHCIINFGGTVGHDVTLEKYVTICPGVNLSGNTLIGEKVMLGAGSVILQGIQIGSSTVVGAGSVIIKNIPKDCTVVGNPGKIVKISGRRV